MTTVTTRRAWVYGDHVNTDVIFPGKYTYTLREPEAIASKALEDLDPTFATGVQTGDVIVAGRNWGCGSSREQAVTALKYCGVRVIIAASFNGLYYRNCINQGVMPLICADLYQHIRTGDYIRVDLTNATIMVDERAFPYVPLADNIQEIVDVGGLLPMLQARFQTG